MVAPDDVKKEIAERFRYEVNRRNLSSKEVSKLAGMTKDTVDSYLSGAREINFQEISLICNKLGINPVRLIFSKRYPGPKLVFRSVKPAIQRFAANVEDAFLLISHFLPDLQVPVLTRKCYGTVKREDLIFEAAGKAQEIRSEHPSPEDFISFYHIPVIPLDRPDAEFDAFLIVYETKMAICVNTAKPPQRIRFSLAHEIAHMLFDSEQEVHIDCFPSELFYEETLTKENIPEFFAYKFAQFYLVPFEKVFDLAERNWPPVNLASWQKFVDENRTSRDVLVNCVLDVLQYRASFDNRGISVAKKPLFLDINEQLKNIKNSKKAGSVYKFLQDQRRYIASIIEKHRHEFSGKILAHLAGGLQLELS